jgi:hypothetical protein
MLSDRHRILELALESLIGKKKQIDEEIAEINRELRRAPARKELPAATKMAEAPASIGKKRSRFSKEERLRRSQRMKTYWENWRKKKSKAK